MPRIVPSRVVPRPSAGLSPLATRRVCGGRRPESASILHGQDPAAVACDLDRVGAAPCADQVFCMSRTPSLSSRRATLRHPKQLLELNCQEAAPSYLVPGCASRAVREPGRDHAFKQKPTSRLRASQTRLPATARKWYSAGAGASSGPSILHGSEFVVELHAGHVVESQAALWG